MKAVRIHSYGTPDQMVVEDVEKPVPTAGQALIRIEAASVNFLDVQQRRGALVKQAFYKREAGMVNDLPVTLGSQGVGVIEAVGEGVSNVKVGDRVSFAGSSYAEYALAPAARLFPIPEGISVEQAAAGMTQGFLAYAFTTYAYPVKEGEWVLVQAAAGGLGSLIVQMAKLRGAKVIGVTSSAEKAQTVRELGADEVIVSTEADIAKEARRITDGKGVRAVFDGVGKDTFEANLDSLGTGGYLVIFGQSSGYIPPFDLMQLQEKGSLFITRTNGLPYVSHFPEYLKDFVGWVRQGKLLIKIDRTYPLAEAAQAHTAFENRQVVGRVLLIP